MRQSVSGSGQDPYQRPILWVAAMGCLLLVAGAMVMMFVLAVVARNSGKASIRSAGDQTITAPASRATVMVPDYLLSDRSLDGMAPGAIPHESAARQALAGGSARLIIEAIDVDAPIQPVGLREIEANGQTLSQWQVPDDYAVGWHRTSAGLGLPGNTVLNGHNNVHGAVFRDLHELSYGEEIIIEYDQHTYRYRVAHRELLDESNQPLSARLDNAQWMSHTSDERLTLISCWPYVGNTQRLIVIATPVEGDQR